jgi:hypothetical protein
MSPPTLTTLTKTPNDRRISIVPKQIAEPDIFAPNPDQTLTATLTKTRPELDVDPPSPLPDVDALIPTWRFPWREILPTWPIERRERWGRRANELAAEGVPWPDDEASAFLELLEEDDPRQDPYTTADEIERQISLAVQFLAGLLGEKDNTFEFVKEAAKLMDVPEAALAEACPKIGVIKRFEDGVQIWSLPRRFL